MLSSIFRPNICISWIPHFCFTNAAVLRGCIPLGVLFFCPIMVNRGVSTIVGLTCKRISPINLLLKLNGSVYKRKLRHFTAVSTGSFRRVSQWNVFRRLSVHIVHIFFDFYFFGMGVLPTCMFVYHMHAWCPRSEEGTGIPWNWVVSHHVGTGTWTWLFCKNNKGSQLLSLLSGPDHHLKIIIFPSLFSYSAPQSLNMGF